MIAGLGLGGDERSWRSGTGYGYQAALPPRLAAMTRPAILLPPPARRQSSAT